MQIDNILPVNAKEISLFQNFLYFDYPISIQKALLHYHIKAGKHRFSIA